MFIVIGLWRKRWFDYSVVSVGVSIFFKISAAFSIFVYLSVIAFIVLMWGSLGWWSIIIAVQYYLILALCGFIFTGKV